MWLYGASAQVQVRQVQKPLTVKGRQQVLLKPWTALLNAQERRLMLQQKIRSAKELLLWLLQHIYVPYHFVENNELDKFAQSFIEVGALYGNVPASDLIVSCTTVRREIVNKSACIQESIKML